MSDPTSRPAGGSNPGGGNKLLVVVVALAVLAAIAVGAWLLFFSGDDAPEGVQVETGQAMVSGGAPDDLAAYLERTWAPNLPEGVTYRIEGNKLLDLNGTIEGSTIKVQEVEFLALDTANEPPHFVDMRVKGLDLTFPQGAGALGTDRLQGDLVYSYEYDPDAKTLKIPAIVLDFPALATLNFSGDFTDMTLSPGGGPESALSQVGEAKIDRLSLVFTDRAVIKWAIEQQAAQQGVDADALRTQAKLMLAALGSQMDGDIEKQAIEAAGTVLEKTENVTIEITANPAEPFPFANFMALGMGAGGMPDLSALEPLNLTIEAH